MDGHHRANGFAAVTELLATRGSSPVDGLLCANDPFALGAMHALNQAGLRVPDDIAVVGFDDIDDSAYGLVPLTSATGSRGRTCRGGYTWRVRAGGAGRP